MFERLKQGLKNLLGLGGSAYARAEHLSTTETFLDERGQRVTGKRATKRDGRLTFEQFLVKRKLGASFFTRRMTAGTRSRHVQALDKGERAIARAAGWIR